MPCLTPLSCPSNLLLISGMALEWSHRPAQISLSGSFLPAGQIPHPHHPCIPPHHALAPLPPYLFSMACASSWSTASGRLTSARVRSLTVVTPLASCVTCTRVRGRRTAETGLCCEVKGEHGVWQKQVRYAGRLQAVPDVGLVTTCTRRSDSLAKQAYGVKLRVIGSRAAGAPGASCCRPSCG